jgi:adenosylcobinamide-phosphate synthase
MSGLGETLFVLAAALALDRLVGDPLWLWRRVPHPIALIGNAIDWLDERLNKGALSSIDLRRRGAATIVTLAVAAFALGWLIEIPLRSGPLGLAIEIVLVAILLAQKSLVDHVAAVARELERGDVFAGRRAVSEIVGRDVAVLDEAGIARAAIESAAENFSDAVVAPAFWFLLLGLPGLLLFKVASTADSMIGHRTPRYEAFGWAAARLDDVMNFLPARLSVLLLAAAALALRRPAGAAIRVALSDAPKHKSPNAGWPEAAVAGALALALGGPRSYGTRAVNGVWLNAPGNPNAGPADIRAAIRLVDAAWAILTGIVAVASIILLAI